LSGQVQAKKSYKKYVLSTFAVVIIILAATPIIPVRCIAKEQALITTVEPYANVTTNTRQYPTTVYKERTEIFQTTTSWPQTAPYQQNLVDDKVAVETMKSIYWFFFVDVLGKQNLKIFGDFSVEAGRDIILYVFDQKGFNSWASGGATTPYVSSGKVGSYSFTFYPDHTDNYYFILDNRYSILTNKVVSISVTLAYETVVTRTQTLTTTRTVTVPETITTTVFDTRTITTQTVTTKTVEVDVNRTNYVSLIEYMLKGGKVCPLP